MESERTKDSIEQLDDLQLKNPITDDDVSLGEAGDAMLPEGEDPERDKDQARGPVPSAHQPPR